MGWMLTLRVVLALTTLALYGGSQPGPAAGHPSLQYLGHSCFVITTPSGERLLIDPFASGEWPGLTLPYVHADRVLVTHPHWDHNAWREVRGGPKVIEEPGRVEGKDFVITGIAGRHAETGGASINWRNTIYLVETGGVRLCHLGDNGPVTPELKTLIGAVDVLMLPVDGEKRVLTYDQADGWIDALSPRLVLPMHYRLPGLALDQITGIGTIDEWLSLQPQAIRLARDTIVLDPLTLPPPGARQVEVLTLPGQRPPDPNAPAPGKATAIEARHKAELAAAAGDNVTALAQFERAASLDPSDAAALEKIGYLQLGAARPDRALEFFQKAVAACAADPKSGSLAWLGMGMALDLLGRREEATTAYRKVVDLGVNDQHQVDEARGYLESPYTED